MDTASPQKELTNTDDEKNTVITTRSAENTPDKQFAAKDDTKEIQKHMGRAAEYACLRVATFAPPLGGPDEEFGTVVEYLNTIEDGLRSKPLQVTGNTAWGKELKSGMARYVRVASADLTNVQDKLIILSDGLEGCRTFVVLPEATPVENLARQLVTVHQAYKAHAAASVLADADMQGEVKFGLLGSLARWAEKAPSSTGRSRRSWRRSCT